MCGDSEGLDRGRPVAREPLTEEILNRPLIKLPDGVSVLQALLDEREEGR